jgi:hypothetical protein
VIYHLAQAAKTAGQRGLLVEKFVVAHAGEPLEFGRRVQAEARPRGLGQAPHFYVVADGGVWIWNIVADRLAEATVCWTFITPASTVGSGPLPGSGR